MTIFNDPRQAAIVFQNSNAAAAQIVAAIVAHPQSDPEADILTLFDTIHTGIFERTVNGIESFIAERALQAGLGATVVQDQTPVAGSPAVQSGPPVPPSPPAQEVRCPTCQGPTWDNRADKKNPKAPDYKCRDKSCDGVVWPPRGR